MSTGLESILNDLGPSPPNPVEAERGTRLEVKRLDKIRNAKSHAWELRDTVADAPNEKKPKEGRFDKYADYAFIVRRKVATSKGLDESVTYITKVFVWSRWLRSALKEVLKGVRSISRTRTDQPLKVDPQTLLAFLPRLKGFLNQIRPNGINSTCPVTSEIRAYKLLNATREFPSTGTPYWKLKCEYVETCDINSKGKSFGWGSCSLAISQFDGKRVIDKLFAYPIQWHTSTTGPDSEKVEDSLVSRGRKWASIPRVFHAQYNGLAYTRQEGGKCDVIEGRIMIDRKTYSSKQGVPSVGRTDKVVGNSADSEDLDFLLYASPILYGFHLTEKRWLQFNVQFISDIVWNANVFKNLALDQNTSTVLRSVIEAHAEDRPFDDFVEGKGLGLVISLFGPPGVGKTLTVEAMSEHLRRPLYVVGAGELGTDAQTVDHRLKEIFSLIPKWNAILLIDEADIFLEKRGTHDLQRNAMVAVFLREIEYFRGILFLTTNRAKEFDHAFQSRIHLSLRYKDLTPDVHAQLWTAFLNHARDNLYGCKEISSEEMEHLGRQNLNGRQIKNVVKVASCLARFEKAPIGYEHLERTLDLGQYSNDGEN